VARSSGTPAAVIGPDENALVAQIEQRLGAVKRGVQLGDAAAELGILGRHAAALADQQYRRQHRRAGDADEQGELDHLHRAEAEGQAHIRACYVLGRILGAGDRRPYGGQGDGGESEGGKPG
jgi:hypothetical protein